MESYFHKSYFHKCSGATTTHAVAISLLVSFEQRGREARAGFLSEAATAEGEPEEVSMPVVTMKELLEAGVHFGHQVKRWNPKMKKYIFGERNGIYIIDLQKTLKGLEEACRFVRETSTG